MPNRMHKEILTDEQIKLLPLLEKFSKNFGLVGGTAVALHIGHRRSIDFDLFSLKKFNNLTLQKKISRYFKIDEVIVNKAGEYTIFIKGVKLTFFHYNYPIVFSERLDKVVKLPNLLTLAAMKLFAMGMRAKWKDYVDVYFILKEHYTITDIVKKGEEIFGGECNEKLFRSQMAYFKDVNYSESVEYMKGFEVSDKIIKKELIKFSLK
ncbi:MAG: nucleotidyl transferase AbiEii/AbiGii toxin family protein [Candidatus Paceibacterota bacterium]